MNALTGFMQGYGASQQINETKARNALAQAVQTQGPRSPQAMNALAGVDPIAAMQMSQPDVKAQREAARGLVQGVLQAPEEIRPQLYAQALQQAQGMGMDLSGVPEQYPGDMQMQAMGALLGMGDQERSEFERLLQSIPEGQRQAAIMTRLGLVPDANATLRAGAEPRDPIAALRMRAAEAGLQPGTPEYSQFMLRGGSSDNGRAIDIDPSTGAVSIREGAGVGTMAKPFTEGQSKDVVYATRARGALEAFEPIAEAMTSFGDRAANMDPTGIIRGAVQSDEFQVAQNAGNEFLQAILRKDTGAAITEQEQELYGKTYLPQPGDNEQVLKEKARARRRAIAAIEAGMSPAQMIAQERGLRAAGSEGREAPPAGIDPEDWEFLTPEERSLFGGSGAANPSEPAADAAGLVNRVSQTGESVAPVTLARAFVGKNETRDAKVLSRFFEKFGGQKIDPEQTAWCAAFVNAVLGASGAEGTGRLNARSFLEWGQPVERPSEGDVVVFSRGDPNGWQGHVGFFAGYEEKNGQRFIRVLGGNQNNGVNEKLYPESRLLGVRRVTQETVA